MAKINLNVEGAIVNDSPKVNLGVKGAFVGATLQKKSPNQTSSPMASSGAESSTDGEDDSFFDKALGSVGGFAKAFYNKALDAVQSSMRTVAASGMSAGTTAPTTVVREIPKPDDIKKNIQVFDKTTSDLFESARFEKKGNADIFEYDKKGDKIGLRLPDAEALGYQVGDGLAQLGLNFLGPVGLAVNYFANTENNYKEARSKGISEDKSLFDASLRSGAETLIDKSFGVERAIAMFPAKQAIKLGVKEAVAQLTTKELTQEAFKEGLKRSIGLFSKEGATEVAKGVGLEFADEFLQTYADEGIKKLFDTYQESKKTNNPNAKIELYDADLGSKKTFVGALNSGFYGGLTGGMGARFANSRAFSPTIYSSLQNAYDTGGVQELEKSKVLVEKGINDALSSGKMTATDHQTAIDNLNKITTDVASYSQNSTADASTRFFKYDIENNNIPIASNKVVQSFTNLMAPVIAPNESDVKSDIESGNMVTMQFSGRENIPDEFVPYVNEMPIVSSVELPIDGGQEQKNLESSKVYEANVPASVAQAYEQNSQTKSSISESIKEAISSVTKSSSFISFDKLVDRIKMNLPTDQAKEAFGLEAMSAKEAVSSELTKINFLNESKDKITREGKFNLDSYNDGLANVINAKVGNKVEYQGKPYTIEDVSYNGQQVKLSGIDEKVNTNDVVKLVDSEQQPATTSPIVAQKTTEQPIIPIQDGEANQQPTTAPGAQGETIQTNTGEAKPLSRAKYIEKAREVAPLDAEDVAIMYFLNGGKVTAESMRKEVIKSSKEIKSKGSLISNKKDRLKGKEGITFENIGERALEGISSEMLANKGISETDVRNAAIEIAMSYSNMTQMAERLLGKYKTQNEIIDESALTDQQIYEMAYEQFEADKLGLTLEEFRALPAQELTDSEIEDQAQLQEDAISIIEQMEAAFEDLYANDELTPKQQAELDTLFASEQDTTQEEQPQENQEEADQEENNPALPPVPPTPTSDEEMAGEEENQPMSDQENDLTILSTEEAKKRAEEIKNAQKTTWESFVEAFVNSDVRIKNVLTRAAGKKSFVVSLLRNRKGLTGAINQTLMKANDQIFRGLNEVGMTRFNSLAYAYRTLQLDENTKADQEKEVARLSQEFIDRNNELPEEKRKPFTQKVRDKFVEQAQKTYPIKSHGTIKMKVDGKMKEIPMTSKIAQETIDSIKQAIGDKAFARMTERVEAYKDFGNNVLKEVYDAGMISKEVYDDLKDDFYSMRMTVERVFDQFSDKDRSTYQSAVQDAFSRLSKDGTIKAMITDTPLLMQTAYNITKRAIKKNELKKAIYEATVAQGKEQEYFKEAELLTRKNKDKKEEVVTDKFGNPIPKDAPRGFELIGYKEGGKIKYFLMDETLHDKMYNLNNIFDSNAIESKFIQDLVNAENLGNRILTGFATRYNPFFFSTNTQMDMAQQIIFTDIWDNGKVVNNLASSTLKAFMRSAKFIDFFGSNKELVEKTLERATELGLMMDMMSVSTETRSQFKDTGLVGPIDQVQSDGRIKKAAKFITRLNLRTEIAMRLAAFSQVQETLTKQFEDKNGRKPNEREQYEIDTIAVAQARAYTDFAEKGTYTPRLNMPYLTSSIAAFSSAMEYIVDNPFKFTWKIAQMASAGIAVQLGILTLMGMIGDPEDWDNVRQYDKDRNILIPIGFSKEKDKMGNDRLKWAFFPIRVNPTLVPFWIASRRAAEATYNAMNGIEKKETSGMEKVDAVIDALNAALPVEIPIPTSKEKFKERVGRTISRKLWMSAVFRGLAGYDPYRSQDLLTYEDRRGESGSEGMENKKVPYVYKQIGKITGLSPVKTKAFIETFTTGNHPVIQTAYALSSDVAAQMTNEKNPTIRGEASLTNIPFMLKGLTGSRFGIASDVNLSYNKEVQDKYNESSEISRKYLSQERELRVRLKDILLETKDEVKFMDRVKKEILPEYEKRKDIIGELDVLETATKLSTKSIKKDAFTLNDYDDAAIIKVTQTPKGQAEMLYYMYGKDKDKATDSMAKSVVLGLSEEDAAKAIIEYDKLINKEKK